MNYHNILHDDMRNGDGLRVTLFISGCDNKCEQCQNPQTWDVNSGIEFDLEAKEEILSELSKDYISGITLSGGDPLHENNLLEVIDLLEEIKEEFGNSKTIWIYTGYTIDFILWEDMGDCDALRIHAVALADVLVDGKFDYTKADVKYHWAGSTNQRVIDVQKTYQNAEYGIREIVLWDNK